MNIMMKAPGGGRDASSPSVLKSRAYNFRKVVDATL